jgi:hypothetical protein
MKRRDFNRFVLGMGLSPILASVQVAGQTETVAQPPSKNLDTDDPMAAVRKYVDAFNRGDAAVMATTFAVPGVDPGRNGPTHLAGANSDAGLVQRCVGRG